MSDFELFSDSLDSLVRRFGAETDLTFTQIIGALEFKKHELIHEAIRRSRAAGEGEKQ